MEKEEVKHCDLPIAARDGSRRFIVIFFWIFQMCSYSTMAAQILTQLDSSENRTSNPALRRFSLGLFHAQK
jgi:hypothetical protein